MITKILSDSTGNSPQNLQLTFIIASGTNHDMLQLPQKFQLIWTISSSEGRKSKKLVKNSHELDELTL